MSQSITFKQAALVVAFIAVVQFIIQMSLLTKGVEYAAVSLTIDDTYYYLQTAWNAKHLGFVTFDGLHPTNGVQLLWFVLILIFTVLVKTKTALLFVTLAVCFLLNALCYIFILKIGAVIKQPPLALFMAGLWFLQSLPFRIYSMGMENSLHALIFFCAIWQSLVFLIRVQNGDKPNYWGLTLTLVLNAWTRLDSALHSAILYSFCMGTLLYTNRHNLRVFLQENIKAITGSVVLVCFGFIAQLSAFQLMGDSFLPISAIVKTSGAGRGLGIESLNKFVEVFILGMPSILQGRTPELVLILLGIFCVLLVIRARATLPGHLKELMAFLNLWCCLLVSELFYHIYIAVSGADYVIYFAWYRSPSFIFWIITFSLAALFSFDRLKLVKFQSNAYKWIPVAACLTIFFVAIYLFLRSINFTSNLYAARYNTSLWITENFQTDAIFASWNAGQLGYFSNRTFINLDGVINNVDYYERVLRGPDSIADYLFENNVDYLVDYATYGAVPDFPIVYSFPIDDGSGRSIHIWQVSPQVSSTPK